MPNARDGSDEEPQSGLQGLGWSGVPIITQAKAEDGQPFVQAEAVPSVSAEREAE